MGGLASCVAAALWPESVPGLVSLASYDVLDIERQTHAHGPPVEHAMWYQHLFQTERGRECLGRRLRITVPAVTLDGASDTLKPGGTAGQAGTFTARHEHRLIDAGHNLPQEAPKAFADAVLTVRTWLHAGERG